MLKPKHLFSKGHPLKREASLAAILEQHRDRTIKKIQDIADLGQMTDEHLEKLVRESLVQPLSIGFDQMTRSIRTENMDARQWLPAMSMGRRMLNAGVSVAEVGLNNSKQVARISIPFTGDEALLEYSPNPAGLNLPLGEVVGNTIQFDLVLAGLPDDAANVSRQLSGNLSQIKACAELNNQQIKQFNESLPNQVRAAFKLKLDQLAGQYAIFDALGIPPEVPEVETMPTTTATPPKKRKARDPQVIMQVVEKMYVQKLNQANYNVGDVNNAIQSNQ